MKLEPGMRVRCVEADGHLGVVEGREYVVRQTAMARGDPVVQLSYCGSFYLARRFKPIVRVKANTLRPLTENLSTFIEHKPWCHGRSIWTVRTSNFDPVKRSSFGSLPLPAPHIFANAH